MGWFRVDEAFGRSPKVLEAGRDAALLFIGLLGVYQSHGEGAQIPPRKASSQALLLELGAFGFDQASLEEALTACERVGLITREGEAILLVGMDGSFQSVCTTCKRAVENPRHKTCGECLAKKRGRRRGKSADSCGPRGKSLPAPEPEPETTPEPEPEADPAGHEGAEILARAGVSMPESLRRRAVQVFMADGGGLWDLRRLARHLQGRPGLLVSVLRDRRKWKDVLLDAPEDPKKDPTGERAGSVELPELLDKFLGDVAKDRLEAN